MDAATEKSVDYLPDIGIKLPDSESARDKVRQSLVNVVTQLQKGDNAADFAASVESFFGEFGLKISSDPVLAQRTRELWGRAYEKHKTSIKNFPDQSVILDLQILSSPYANMIFEANKTVQIDGKDTKVTHIYPGWCSLPRPVSKDAAKNSYNRPDRNFYPVFEQLIGVDSISREKPIWQQNPHISQNSGKLFNFFVTAGKYLRIPIASVPQ